MAATAYAAVISLTQIIDQVLTYHHTRQQILIDEQHTLINDIQKNVCCMQEFLETYSHVAESLPSQIADVAHEVEDILESHVVDNIRYRSDNEAGNLAQFQNEKDQRDDCLSERLEKVIKDMVTVEEIMEKIKQKEPENVEPKYLKSRDSVSVGSVASDTIEKQVTGFDHYMDEITDRLQEQPNFILQITGMGGMGKTTLAKKVYDNKCIHESYEIRGWITLSQTFDPKEKLISLLHDIGVSISEDDKKRLDYDILGTKLYKYLLKRTYLIVLDDLWSLDAFEKIKRYLPNNQKSRIMVTTRQSYKDIGPCSFYEVKPLDEVKSWDLLCGKVFSTETCPPDLIDVGEKIAKNCRGLPLSLVVIAGHLAQSNKTREVWELVAERTSRFANSGSDELCRKTLYLSYSQLPIQLKPCFLYMGIFPEDHMIRVSELISLWIVEGFLKPTNDKTLDEVAKGHLRDLIDRNLVSATKFGSTGNLKACQIHDVLRDFCLTEAATERFFCNIIDDHETSQDIDNQRRFVMHDGFVGEKSIEIYLQSASLARSATPNFTWADSSSVLPFKLMRVCYMEDEEQHIIQLLNLRYFYVYSLRDATSIGMLWNLQTVMVGGGDVILPPEIWKLPYLRHIMMQGTVELPEVPDGASTEQDESTILRNLQILWNLYEFRFTEEALRRIPNVQKLKMGIILKGESLEYYQVKNLCRFEKLHSLRLVIFTRNDRELEDFRQNIEFPRSLKKLYLDSCTLDWEDVNSKIGTLPNLEKLTIYRFIEGDDWNPVEGHFQRLKFLNISGCDLFCWNANKSHFPLLEQLVLSYLHYLLEVPFGVGEIETLQKISWERCRSMWDASVIRILENRRRLGMKDLDVVVDGTPLDEDDVDDDDDDEDDEDEDDVPRI